MGMKLTSYQVANLFGMNRKSNIAEVADKLLVFLRSRYFEEMVGKRKLTFIKYQPCARHC